MLTTNLGACEWFVWDLHHSNLIDRGQLDQVIGEFLSKNPGAEPPAMADYLVGKGFLTAFQAERLLQGKTKGFVLGPFTLMDALGAGSMGTVYKALSKTDNKCYAVKVLPRRSMWNVRIARRKVRLFEQCQHQAVVPFVDVGTAGGMHYLAWPMVEGRPLEKLVQERGKLGVEEAVRFALQTADGLEAAQQINLFHGLLKPSNLMIHEDRVRILDFGIGCLLSETEGESLVDTMSTANSVNSGLDCSSPESIMDPTNLSAVGDQYSLGCVLYFCLTGRYPFPDGTAVEKMMCHQHKQPTPITDLNSEVPGELVAVVERLMQKNPAHRFGGFTEVIEALRPFVSTASSPGLKRRPTMQMPRLPRPPISDLPAPAAPAAAPLSPSNHSGPAGRSPAAPGGPIPRVNGTLPPRPAAAPPPAAPQPARPAVPTAGDRLRPSRQEPQRPTSTAEPAESAPPEPSSGGFSLLTVVLLALLAGVAAFFLSRFLPI